MKNKKELIRKQLILDLAKIQLKKEFVGLDEIIDNFINSISSWYLFPDFQERPTIINVWGLTGTGKSSLVNRLAQLIDFDKYLFSFDLGENEKSESTIKEEVKTIYKLRNGLPSIIMLDEFQHARTIDEHGHEISDSKGRIVWELMSSGKFNTINYSHGVNSIQTFLGDLKCMILQNVKVLNGEVVSEKKLFVDEMGINYERDENNKKVIPEKVFCVSSYHQSYLFEMVNNDFTSIFELKKHLLSLNENETIDFIERALEVAKKPKIVDCSKALVFVLGNLDEAYTMSEDFNPDTNADDFHRQSLGITVPMIKNALKKRFRNEQIARLGNNHIIYPAFSSDSFVKIIKLELEKIKNKAKQGQNISLQFDDSVIGLIYNEGVYPTQGTRPLFSTINQIINTKLGNIFSEIVNKRIATNDVFFEVINGCVNVNFLKNNKSAHKMSFKKDSYLEGFRESTRDDIQAITAVHEAGHSVLSIILLQSIPSVVHSTSSDGENNGTMYSRINFGYNSKSQILKKLALYFGGLAAEKLIFGSNNITSGSGSDIREATKYITSMIKEAGMGNLPAKYQKKDQNTLFCFHDEIGSADEEVRTWIRSGFELAEETLKEQEVLLLKISDFLCDNRKITKDELKKMTIDFAVNFNESDIVEDTSDLFYRKHLKNKVKLIGGKKQNKSRINTFDLSLNKNK